jgi:hypothetical protein
MKKEFERLGTEMTAAKERLKQVIRDLPDCAEGVRMLGPRCGTVSIRQVAASEGFNLSPRYWLTASTKQKLIEAIDRYNSIETIQRAIGAILAEGKIDDGTKVPPNFIAALKKAWEG